MDITASRFKVIEDLKLFCTQCEEVTDAVCKALLWDKESLRTETVNLVTCPYNPGHRVPSSSLSKHTEMCCLKSRGISQEDIDQLVPSSQFYYEKASNVFSTVLDKETQSAILRQQNTGVFIEKDVPISGQQAIIELTPKERLAVHQHVINAAKDAGKPVTELSDDLLFADLTKNRGAGAGEPKSKAEALAQQRDLKRRRQTYRAKNVHITKKSYTEVIREVIENQTEMLRQSADSTANTESSVTDQEEPSRTSSRSQNREKSRSRSPSGKYSSSRSRRRSRSRSGGRSRSRSRRRSGSRSRRRSRSRKRSKSGSRRRSRSSSRPRNSPFKSSQSERGTDDGGEDRFERRDNASDEETIDSRDRGTDDHRKQEKSKKHKHKSKHKKHKSDKHR